MRYKVFTDKKSGAPETTIVVANSDQSAKIFVEGYWEGCKATKVVLLSEQK